MNIYITFLMPWWAYSPTICQLWAIILLFNFTPKALAHHSKHFLIFVRALLALYSFTCIHCKIELCILISFEIIMESACIFECGTRYSKTMVCALRFLSFERLFLQIREKKFITLSLEHRRVTLPIMPQSSNCKLKITKHRRTLLYIAIYWYVGVVTLVCGYRTMRTIHIYTLHAQFSDKRTRLRQECVSNMFGLL